MSRGTMYSRHNWSGGTSFSITDGPGGPFILGTDGPGGPLTRGTVSSMTDLLNVEAIQTIVIIISPRASGSIIISCFPPYSGGGQ